MFEAIFGTLDASSRDRIGPMWTHVLSIPIRDDAGQVVAALSVGASSDRIRRREAELADMLRKEALIVSRAMAQPAKPNSLRVVKAG